MVRPPVISIIITAYNTERFLAATLDSVLAQTVQDWECIVVDDGSTDQTLAIAREYAERDGRIRVVTKENGGTASARNRGREEIGQSSRYISFLDSDDVWKPAALKILLNELEQHPEAVGAHGLADNIDKDGNPVEEGFTEYGRNRSIYRNGEVVPCDVSVPTTFELLAWTNHVFPPGVLMTRRCYYDKAGPFEGFARRLDDWDMVVRLSRYGNLRFINEVIISYRRHGGNISASRSLNPALRQMHYKMFFSPENTEDHKRLLKRGWRELQLYHVRKKWKDAREKVVRGQLVQATTTVAGMYVQLHRYVRGYPTVEGI